MQEEVTTICPADLKQWRQWLKKNHRSAPAVWVVYYKKHAGTASISWSEAVDEALCFGWIDSTRRSIDKDRFVQFFTKRKPKSVWSKINKEKVERLIREGRMSTAGHQSIALAKENGYWDILNEVEALTIPRDLEKAFRGKAGARAYFSSLSKSVKKAMLQWVTLAKRPQTRDKRIDEIVQRAAEKQKPKQF